MSTRHPGPALRCTDARSPGTCGLGLREVTPSHPKRSAGSGRCPMLCGWRSAAASAPCPVAGGQQRPVSPCGRGLRGPGGGNHPEASEVPPLTRTSAGSLGCEPGAFLPRGEDADPGAGDPRQCPWAPPSSPSLRRPPPPTLAAALARARPAPVRFGRQVPLRHGCDSRSALGAAAAK